MDERKLTPIRAMYGTGRRSRTRAGDEQNSIDRGTVSTSTTTTTTTTKNTIVCRVLLNLLLN